MTPVFERKNTVLATENAVADFIVLVFGKYYVSIIRRMQFSGIWCCVSRVRSDVSEECVASSFKVKRIRVLWTLAVTSTQYEVTIFPI
jgi:hypothetical protein